MIIRASDRRASSHGPDTNGSWCRDQLDQYSFLGFPLGYYMAAQGSLAIFVVEIAVYAASSRQG